MVCGEGSSSPHLQKASKSWARSQGLGEGHYDYSQSIGHFTARPHRRQLDTRLPSSPFPSLQHILTTQLNISVQHLASIQAFLILILVYPAQLIHHGSHQGGKSPLVFLVVVLVLEKGGRCCKLRAELLKLRGSTSTVSPVLPCSILCTAPPGSRLPAAIMMHSSLGCNRQATK